MRRRQLLAAGLAPIAGAQGQTLWLLDGQQLLGLEPDGLQTRVRHELPWAPELPPRRQGATLWLARRDGELLALDLDSGARRQAQLGALAGLEPSADGAWLLALGPQRLQLLDRDELRPRATHELGAAAGGALPTLARPERRSLLLAPQRLPELWELYLDPGAEDFYAGLVHDYRFGEGVATRGFLGRRRIALAAPARELWAGRGHFHVALLLPGELQMFNLDARRPAGRLRLPEAPTAAALLEAGTDSALALAQGQELQLIGFERAHTLARRRWPAPVSGLWAGAPGELYLQLLGRGLLRLDAALQPRAAAPELPRLQALLRQGAGLYARSAAGWLALHAQDLELRAQRPGTGLLLGA